MIWPILLVLLVFVGPVLLTYKIRGSRAFDGGNRHRYDVDTRMTVFFAFCGAALFLYVLIAATPSKNTSDGQESRDAQVSSQAVSSEKPSAANTNTPLTSSAKSSQATDPSNRNTIIILTVSCLGFAIMYWLVPSSRKSLWNGFKGVLVVGGIALAGLLIEYWGVSLVVLGILVFGFVLLQVLTKTPTEEEEGQEHWQGRQAQRKWEDRVLSQERQVKHKGEGRKLSSRTVLNFRSSNSGESSGAQAWSRDSSIKTNTSRMTKRASAAKVKQKVEKKGIVIIDGLNVIRVKGKDNPDLRVLLAVIGWLVDNQRDFLCFFDAATHFTWAGESDKKTYERLLASDHHFIEVTGGMQADDVIVDEAKSHSDSVIISNDQFRQFNEGPSGDFEWLKDKLVKVVLSRDVVRVYGPLRFEASLPDDKRIAAILSAIG